MDLNPTFGHHELLETLSQKSASSTKSTTTTNTNTNSKQVNEAVRRLGYRLSMQAHGGDIRSGAVPSMLSQQQPPIRRALDHSVGQSGFASFLEYNKTRSGSSSVDATETETDINHNNKILASLRTSKVAKTHYSDHGEHSSGTTTAPTLKITRKLTLNCKECFRNWEDTQRNVVSAVNLSPTHRFSLEQLALSGGSHIANNNKATTTMRNNNMSRQRAATAAVTNNNHPLLGSRHDPLPPSLEEDGYEDDEDGSNADADDDSKQQQPMDDIILPSNHSHMSRSQGSHSVAAKRRKARLSVHTGSPGTNRSNQSLLSAVMEAESNTSVTSNSDQQKQHRQQHQSQQQQHQLYKHGDESATSQSISTKDSKSLGIPPQPPSAHHKPRQPERNKEQENNARWARGKCLTTPSEAIGNGGLDNVEGNLIVFENDSIVVARRNMRTIQRSRQQQQRISKNSDNNQNNAPTAEFRIQGLQGQGTFAQVFQCLHVQTGKLVAVKIIKNKAVYTRQAAIEIDIFQTLQQEETTRQSIPTEAAAPSSTSSSRQQQRQKSNESSAQTSRNNLDYMVNLDFYFMHQNHLCLVFELLGLNLYEVLKRRQFRGLPMSIVRDIVKQVIEGCRDLSQKNVVHCDLKPENILLLSKEANISVVAAGDARSRVSDRSSSVVGGSSEGGGRDGSTMSSNEPKPQPSTSTNSHATTVPTSNTETSASKVKIIDFGSACFEGYTAHTYIQSRFYRSPEVLMGLPYDSAIDMWSLGCVAAELFLGLPILPGVHEHDQLVRIAEMVASIPEWMVDQGSKSTKYFVKYVPRPNGNNRDCSNNNINDPSLRSGTPSSGGGSLPLPQWRLKTQQEYISSLSQASIQKKGGIEKLNKQPGTRYFKQTKLSDILFLQAHQSSMEERELIPAFVHFLYGILDPDPWKRWTAFQASQHPFVTGNLGELRPKGSNVVMDPKEENQANLEFDMYWPSPWDPAICRRKLLNVQKMREKQQSMRRTVSSRSQQQQKSPWMGGDSALLRAGRGSVGLDTIPMLMAGQQQQQQQHREPSPPMQISPSNSTSGSHAGMAVSVGESSGFVAPVNWHRQAVQSVNPSQLAFGNGSQINDNHSATISAAARQQYYGAQSLQGGMGYTPTDVDFGQALMRPGVIPGSYGMGTSVASQSTAASFQVGNSSQNFLYGGGHAFLQDGTPRGMLNTQGGPLFESYMSGVPGQVSQEDPFRGMTSAASSVTMTDAASHAGDPRQIDFLAQQQKQQMAFLQQQQMMQQSFQQHQQFALQQPMIASGPGGFYYVTTSSTGQPILLQPVGLLNQQGVGGQMFMNGQPGANQQQGAGGQMFMNGQSSASQQGVGGQMFMNGQPGATQQLQNLNQQLYAQQPVMHNPQQMQNAPPSFSGIQQPQQQHMYQQEDQQLYVRQQQQQLQQPPPQQQQQRYVAPRDQYRHERGGGTSY